MADQTYRALLIANSTFPKDRDNLPDLEGPRNDTAVLRDVLCDDAVGLFPSDNIRLVIEREMSEIMLEVEEFLVSASSRDTLLLYYSGHGVLDETNDLYFCARDTRTTRLGASALSASWVSSRIDRSAAGATVIVLDCCHAGAFKGGAIAPPLAGAGRFVVSSVRASELASDTDARNHASIFTSTLVEGLRRGVEDLDHDGFVKLTDLYNYVYEKLSVTGRQLPQKRFSGTGDVPMALRPKNVGGELPSRPPELDVSQSRLDLGDVWSDEAARSERVMVINRGGGSLDWKAASAAPWLTLESDSSGVTMHLAPQLGPNEADVIVHDAVTDTAKTIHVSVNVRERSLGATTERDGSSAPPPRPDRRRLLVAGGLAALVVAVLLALVLWRPWDSGSASSTTTTTPTTAVPLAVDAGRTSCAAGACTTDPITFTVNDVDASAAKAVVTVPGDAEFTDIHGFTQAGIGTAQWQFAADDTWNIGDYRVVFDYNGRQSAAQTFTLTAVPGSFGIIQQLDAAIIAKDYDRARSIDDGLTHLSDDDIASTYSYPWARIMADPTQIGATTSGLDGAYLAYTVGSSGIEGVRVDCERWDFHDGRVTTRARGTAQTFDISTGPFDVGTIRAKVNAGCPATTTAATTTTGAARPPTSPATTG
jgi:hypothetical protein